MTTSARVAEVVQPSLIPIPECYLSKCITMEGFISLQPSTEKVENVILSVRQLREEYWSSVGVYTRY